MIVKVDKSFERDVKKITDKKVRSKIADCIEELQKAEKYQEIKGLKKIKSSGNLYRIRIGQYRIGIIIIKNKLELIRCLHRKNIYKYFPK
ncbi:MAG: type II toxin-antitoxin system RelE/ParE family toxin [bacterium]